MSNFVKIVEVSPRDGLQNIADFVDTDIKIELIERLIGSGLSVIESTSFVSPKWVPQMCDHVEIIRRLPQNTSVQFPVLVPNMKGLEQAIASGCTHIAVFAAASESFSQKNINCSIAESIKRFQEVILKAKKHSIHVRGYVSCVLGCPYEGDVSFDTVSDVSVALYEAGCYEISLGDTIGIGTPYKAKTMLNTVARNIPLEQLAIHFHNTYGQAIANAYACLEEGVRIVDSSTAGLGGCPYAKGASGNVATEDIVYLCDGLNLSTGIDLNKLIETGNWICSKLKLRNDSKVAQANRGATKQEGSCHDSIK